MTARLRRIQRAEQQCTDLISALLLLSRNERGHGVCDVGKVAEQLLETHRAQLGGKPLVLRMEGEGGLVVDAPEAAVAVALGNLIGNAVKYTHEGEVVVRMAFAPVVLPVGWKRGSPGAVTNSMSPSLIPETTRTCSAPRRTRDSTAIRPSISISR